MYNYRNIHKKAYTNADIVNQEAANMSNAFGGAPANRQAPVIINNTVPAQPPQQSGSSIWPWLLIGGTALAGLGAWHKFGPKIQGWANTYKTYKQVAPAITSSARGLKDNLQGVHDSYNKALRGKPRFIPEPIYSAYWTWKNRKKLMKQMGDAAKHARDLESANKQLYAAGNM